ncbi:MAG: hypothetical protein WBI40_02065 [Methylococcaceae bacterium]
MKKIITLAFLTVISTQSFAACKQTDAKGTWITYQAAFVTTFNDQHIGQCKIVVDKLGSVDAASSSCQFVTFNQEQIPTGGTFKVNTDCSADINLELGSFVGQVQIAKDKSTYTGRFETDTISGITNAVKQ